MSVIKHIPNAITSVNVLCGCIAIVMLLQGHITLVPVFFAIGIAADYADGFVARLLNAKSPIGKELDSLADMVTFGFLPGAVLYHLTWQGLQSGIDPSISGIVQMAPYAAFILTVFSALRLAKFNVDESQTESFKGLATPACALYVIGLLLISVHEVPYFIAWVSNPVFLLVNAVVLSGLLVSNIPMFSFKVKGFGWSGNEIRYLFLIICVILLITFKFAGIALCIVAYVLSSIIHNTISK